MFRFLPASLGLAVLLSSALAAAQTVPPESAPPAYNGASEHVDGANVPPIPSASFSARANLETTQTLADGSAVTHRTYNIIARDFRGRTHNEARYWFPADGSEARLNYIVLYDPDTRTRTYLYPSTKLARQFVLPKQVNIHTSTPPTPNPLAPTIQKDDLGADLRDGLELKGLRETRTYPAGSIGNEKSLAITNEFWYSPDLHLNMLVKRLDPRFGTQTVQIVDLRRDEPNAALFEIPSDYKIVNETNSESAASGGLVPPGRIRLGGTVAAAHLINRVQPAYPEAARHSHIQGTVRLHTVIGKDGTVQQLAVVSGHPLLVQAALDAVRQWRYSPVLLNGEPVEVDTTIDVIFALRPQPTS